MTQPVAVGSAPAKSGRKRLFVLLGVGVAVLLVTFVLPKLIFGGGGDDGGDELATPVTVAPENAPTVTAAPPTEALPPETIEVFTNKNPFTPLVDMTPGGSAAVPTGTGSPSTASPVPVQTDPGATVTVPPATAPVPGTATGPRPVQRVSLVDVSSDEGGVTRATIQVNDTLYEVAEGEEFAGSYQVISLSDSEGCAQLLYGDDRFRVCEGEELLK